ncbi:Cytoplasmic polyadenylation element-binding protein 4, partial [Eschrichtius robustus]|nr:Cytoplasmic polyadenylation element-binding protein 4 [Eschrichtius robustus]
GPGRRRGLGGGDPEGHKRSAPGSELFSGSRGADPRGSLRSSIPADASRSSGSGAHAGAAQPRPAPVLACKMLPVYPEVKPNPLQDANLCSRVLFCKQLMNSFLYVIGALDQSPSSNNVPTLNHIPYMSYVTAALQLLRAPSVSVTLSPSLPLSLRVRLSVSCHDWSVHLTSPFPIGNLSTSTFEDHSGDGVPEVCQSSLFPMEDGFLDDGRGDQPLHSGLGSPHCFTHQNGERVERYSRKVFVGGLPPDIDEDEITASFRRFGPLIVDWPHKAESKSYFPPKGYAFLLFQDESSVQALIDACIEEDGKLYLCVSSPTIKDKPVQIRPWNLSDSDFVMDGSQPLDPRKTIFVGGVPRPLRAVELAMIMDRLYGGVCYAGIDTDPELKYPKGAGRVAFSNQQSYIAAISARFVQLQHGEIDKRVEVKPYVLDDQLCDECQGARCGGKFAPFFCANVTCLQYYCEYCWAAIHSRAGREFHKPLVKEGGDRPRHISFRWN